MRILGALAVTLLAASAAHADVHVCAPAKLSVDLPKAWHVTTGKDPGVIRAASPDQAVAVALWVIPKPDLKAAIKEIDKQLVGVVKHQKWAGGQADVLHGMRAYTVEGTGVSGGGNPIDLLVVVVGPTPNKKAAIVLAAVDHAKLDAHWSEVEKILKSVAPAK
jgi:hypothetical protein